MNTAVSIIVAIVMLSVLIIVHEWGHYLLARKNGIFVKEFSVGFGPRIVSVVGRKTGTRFSWKVIPFGGSCQMLGALEDAGDDNEDGEIADPAPDERSYEKKSVWARMSVTLAGPVFNFILALVFSIICVAVSGYDPAVVISVPEGTGAYEAGLREGDVITRYNGAAIDFSREIALENYINPVSEMEGGVKVTYLRDGQKYDTIIYPKEESYYAVGFSYYPTDEPAEILAVSEGGPMEQAGFEAGDIILSINGYPISSGSDIEAYLEEHPLDGQKLEIDFLRRGGERTLTVTPVRETVKKLGFSYNRANVKANAIETLKYGFAELKYQITSVFKSLGILFSDKGSLDMLSGPVGIVEVVSDTYTSSVSYGFLATLISMLSLTSLLSANLGVMNLLPIPALDGGKFILLVIEAIIRKPVPRKVETVVTIIGAGLLFLLMIVVFANDIIKLF